MDKYVNKLHLIYGYTISSLFVLSIIVCWILSCKGLVSENAFQNFSFAASIVSIVLAVVSIVYTIYSGAGVSNSIDILKEAEQNIKQQVDALNGLENRIINAVEEGNDGLSSKISEVQNKIEPFVRENLRTVNYSAQTNKDLINVSFNSVLGNALLYICLRSIETNKSWPIDILGNEMKLYFQGYLVAMASVSTLQFHYETENDFQIIKSCSFGDSFNVMEYKTKIIDDIKQKIGDEQSSKLLKTIEDYFS